MSKFKFLSVLTLGSLLLATLPVHAASPYESFSGRMQQSLSGGQGPSLNAIAQGEILEPGQAGPGVEVIRSLMIEIGYDVAPSGELFDQELSWQLGKFQEELKLAEPRSEHWGRLGPATLQALKNQASRGRFNAELGRKLADYARNRISGGSGYCYHYVAKAIHAYLPPFLKGLRAYMADSQLARSGYFKEIDVPASELPSLPAGAVVVWAKGKSPSGHISIADGRGNEISDHIGPQMTAHYGGAPHRVFLPIGKS